MKLAGRKNALPILVYSTDRSKPVLVLPFVALWFSLRSLAFVTLFLYFSVLIALDYLAWGRKRANLRVLRAFVRFALVWFCLFPFPLCVWGGLRLVIVELPGLFSYLLFLCNATTGCRFCNI